MKPFASREQYEARYGKADAGTLDEALMDATMVIASELERAGVGFSDPSDEFAGRLMQACRSMAHRAVASGALEAPAGATQFSQGAGGYTESFTLGNPYGEVYMSKAERRLLGLGGAKVGFVGPFGGGADA